MAPEFLVSVVKAGNHIAKTRRKSTVQQHCHAIVTFGHFLKKNHKLNVSKNLKRGLSPQNSSADWIYALYQFRRFLELDFPNSTQVKVSSSMNTWLLYLSGYGVCPSDLKMALNRKKNEKPQRRSIIDVELTELGFKSLEAIKKRMDIHGEFSGSDEIEAIYNNITLDLDEASWFTDENLEVEVSGCTALSNRLELIYNGAKKTYLKAKSRRVEGERIVNSGKKYASLINNWLESGSQKGKNDKELKSVRVLTDEQFYAGVLSWCMTFHEHPGLPPYEGQTCNKKLNRIKNEFSKRKSISFKASEFIELIGVSRELLASVYLIIMFETWANPSSILSLEVRDKKSLTDSLSVIDWRKPRAGAILSQYDNVKPLCLSEVIDYLVNATANYRAKAKDADRDFLFLHAYSSLASAKGRVKVAGERFIVCPSGEWMNNFIKKLTLGFSSGNWCATPKQIRNSLILQETLKHGLDSAKEKAKHKSVRTTRLYAESVLVQLQKDKEIQEFLNWLETLVTINVEDIPKKLGIDEGEYEARKNLILKSNFGGAYCSDAYSGYQEGSEVGSPCAQVVRCMTCEKRMNVLVASEENIRHLLYWKQALEEAYDKGLITKKDSGWVQWLTFVNFSYDRLSKSVRYKGLLIETELSISSRDNPYALSIFERV